MRIALSFGSFVLCSALAVPAHAEPPETVRFESHVRTILRAHCFHCHGDEEEKQANLDLRLARGVQSGGDSGPAVRPGDAAGSLLYQRIAAGEMPPGEKKLSADEQATIAAWIDGGAVLARPEPPTLSADAQWTAEERGFWSLRPVVRPPIPAGASLSASGGTEGRNMNPAYEGIVRTPVDAFLLA